MIRTLFSRAQRSNVAIYALDPAGLMGLETILMQPGYGEGLSGSLTLAQASARATLNRDFLHTVADNTGGFAVTEGQGAVSGIERMFEQTGSNYLLGFRIDPSDRRRQRRVDVRVARDDAVVRTHAGVPTDAAVDDRTGNDIEATLARALGSLVPESELPMTVNVIPFRHPDRGDAVLVVAARLRQPAPARRTVERVELRVTAFDPDGRQRASRRQRAELALLPADDQAEYEVLTQVTVRPGRYSLRLAGHQASLGETGSVFYDIDVPDFSTEHLSMSGIALSASPGVLAAPRDALENVLPLLPTTQRTFNPAENVTAFVRVYRSQRERTTGEVSLVTRIQSAGKRVVFEEQRTLTDADFGSEQAAAYRLRLPLNSLVSGHYALMIEASLGEIRTTRIMPFGVE
jgi:hypothetical protein